MRCILSKNSIKVGETLEISIVGAHKGAMLQVRPNDGSYTLTGEFSDDNNLYKVLDCNGQSSKSTNKWSQFCLFVSGISAQFFT